MGSRVTEVGRPVAIGVNSSVSRRSAKMLGFYGTVAGTLSATDVNGVVVLNALPVATGWNSMPFFFEAPIETFTTAGGAAGVLSI
jgi:hypothetical protein